MAVYSQLKFLSPSVVAATISLTLLPCLQIKASDPGLQKLLYGAFGLPFGLALIVICGGELYTGNAAFLPCAVYEVAYSSCHVNCMCNHKYLCIQRMIIDVSGC